MGRTLLKRGFMRTLIFFCWPFVSMLTLGMGFYLLLHKESFPRLAQHLSFKPQAVYSLFSAVPKNGEVLAQDILSKDTATIKLGAFLAYRKSPLEPYAEDFIKAAREYNIPDFLTAAIACKESKCGLSIPTNSYNPFGWGVYTNQLTGVNFSSWKEAIWRVSRGLREDYFDRGLDTLEEIEPLYAPPSAAKGHPWLLDVEYFMYVIENWQ